LLKLPEIDYNASRAFAAVGATVDAAPRTTRTKGVAMKTVTALLTGAVLTLVLFVPSNVRAEETKETEITEKSFGCLLGGNKVGNTYISNPDPEKLKEAMRIYRDNVQDTDYPIGTILQLFPDQAMVKHPAEKFPLTNGWEFFEFEIAQHRTIIRAHGDRISNRNSVPCMACHQNAPRYDFVCGKGHGCTPLSYTDQKIAEIQAADERCTKK
jgi:hypothetical protein